MGKTVVVIAAGLTETEALPYLLRDLIWEHDCSIHVRVPPRNQPLTPNKAANLIKAAWWDLHGRGESPDKFVILVDADGASLESRKEPFREVCERLRDIPAFRVVAAVQWHLEAWFFGDEGGLRSYLGRDLGSVDASEPDSIINPKLQLKHLLGVPYTASVAGEIARCTSPAAIRSRSRSFAAFEQSVKDGYGATTPGTGRLSEPSSG